MSDDYKVRLVARGEGLYYRDERDVYRFNVSSRDKTWKVYLPGSRGEAYEPHELTDEERRRILPRIERYFRSEMYFGLFGSSCPVVFERK
ncbi:MAG TPA: hypothetical protein VGH91_13420 [Gammaproteobacteria bacterium]|jgi:hypothetical protein